MVSTFFLRPGERASPAPPHPAPQPVCGPPRRMLATQETWENFYQQHQDEREWYIEPRLVLSKVVEHVEKVLGHRTLADEAVRILHAGCGTSKLCADLTRLEGTLSTPFHTAVQNVDFSVEAVHLMQERYPELSLRQEDCRSLSFDDGSFDMVVDKGTLDSMSSNSEESSANVSAVLGEYHRCLHPKGVALVFSLFDATKWRALVRGSNFSKAFTVPLAVTPMEIPGQKTTTLLVLRP